jgi:hypothetical protein
MLALLTPARLATRDLRGCSFKPHLEFTVPPAMTSTKPAP